MSNIERNKNNIYVKIRFLYPSLTKFEKKIADIILNEQEDFTAHTIASCAKKAKCSEMTVTRFCKRLGMNGFVDLKNNLEDIAFYTYNSPQSRFHSGDNLSWYISEMLPEYKDTCLKNGKDIYEEVNSLVGQLPADEHCPIFLPFLFGSHAHPNAKASFVGISSFHTRAHIARAIFEGVAFAHRYHLDRLLKARTSPVRAIRFTGGGAKSGVWSQMFADVMNLPVETVDANEMGTLGCAIAAATSLGIYETATEAASKMSRISARYTPISQNHQAYEEKYALYKATVEALDCVWPQFQQYIEGHSFS